MPNPRLFRLSDGRFQIIEDGPLSPFLSGHDYLLIESGLAEYLVELDVERISIEDAVVWDRKSDIEYSGYKYVRINQHFNTDQINDIDVSGVRMLVLGNQYPFVSPELKNRLEQSKFSYLKFSEGLNGWAGKI